VSGQSTDEVWAPLKRRPPTNFGMNSSTEPLRKGVIIWTRENYCSSSLLQYCARSRARGPGFVSLRGMLGLWVFGRCINLIITRRTMGLAHARRCRCGLELELDTEYCVRFDCEPRQASGSTVCRATLLLLHVSPDDGGFVRLGGFPGLQPTALWPGNNAGPIRTVEVKMTMPVEAKTS